MYSKRPKTCKVYCQECGKERIHEVKRHFKVTETINLYEKTISSKTIETPNEELKFGDDFDDEVYKNKELIAIEKEEIAGHEDIEYWYQIIMCRGCDTLSFRKEKWYLDREIPPEYDLESGEELTPATYEKDEPIHYPNRFEGMISLPKFIRVPRIVEKAISESVRSYNYGLDLLSTMSLRIAIELICNEENIPKEKKGQKKQKSNRIYLNDRIKLLAQKKNIEWPLAKDLIEFHKKYGDIAAHSGKTASKENLRLAISNLIRLAEVIFKETEAKMEKDFRDMTKNPRFQD